MNIDNRLLAGLFVLVVAVAVISTNLIEKEPVEIGQETKDLEVTIYNQNLGVVKEYRNTYLDKGLNDVLYKGVASSIDPTSVKIKSTEGDIEVLEQNYLYDLVSKNKILEKYVGKEIKAYQVYGDNKELVEGKLLSHNGNELILQDDEGGIKTLSASNLELPSLPSGLITKPTLQWLIDSEGPGNKTLELSYMTSGMSWRANYVATIDNDDSLLDMNGWVTINNNAGTTYENASLKLVAGDVSRETRDMYKEAAMDAAGSSQFRQESFFEYHLYDLNRRTTLKNNQQKQVSLLEAPDVSVQKEYVFDTSTRYGYSSSGQQKVDVMLNFNNTDENNLGMALPAGTVRVFKKDSEGKLQFIGEDSIDHTPKDERLRIKMGSAFDVVGEKKQADYSKQANWYEYTWEVELRNHKDEDIIVTVIERTGGDWEILEETHEHKKVSQNEIKWRVPVKADSKQTLTYNIRYRRW